jgi:phosphoglycerate dehydrogenase-like enzyme
MSVTGRVLLASTFLPGIQHQLQEDMPDWEVTAVDLGTRDRPLPDIGHLADDIASADAIMPLRGVLDARVIKLADSCRIIQQFGAGVDTVDMAAARARRIPVCNVPSKNGGNADSVAEMALFHMIGAGRSFPRLQELVAREDFAAPFGVSLFGKTVCIVGYGNIGTRVGRLVRPFGGRVIGIRRGAPAEPKGGRGPEVWPPSRLNEALGLADFVVVTIPLSPSTEGIIGQAQFDAMKPGARIVNVSRGGTIDREAMLAAMASGRVAAAGLDVFWEEPVKADDPILGFDVVATPHCGGLTDHMRAGTSRVAAANMIRAVSGGRARYRVDRAFA